jgi:cytochrome P450
MFSDISSLPYIQAIVKEVLQRCPPLLFSIPHCMTEDNWYDGMFIPKGTTCVPNLWQCHHDPAVYGDNTVRFNPEQFLDSCGKITSGPTETQSERHVTYGFGKQSCIGNHVANDSLSIFMATLLWAMNLERVCDDEGKETPVDTESFFNTGMVV